MPVIELQLDEREKENKVKSNEQHTKKIMFKVGEKRVEKRKHLLKLQAQT